jgi:hypothetical protein
VCTQLFRTCLVWLWSKTPWGSWKKLVKPLNSGVANSIEFWSCSSFLRSTSFASSQPLKRELVVEFWGNYLALPQVMKKDDSFCFLSPECDCIVSRTRVKPLRRRLCMLGTSAAPSRRGPTCEVTPPPPRPAWPLLDPQHGPSARPQHLLCSIPGGCDLFSHWCLICSFPGLIAWVATPGALCVSPGSLCLPQPPTTYVHSLFPRLAELLARLLEGVLLLRVQN